jgi:hypothetical protein
MSRGTYGRREFLAGLAGALALPALRRRVAGAQSDHPRPRPGIDASRVVPAERLGDHPDAAPVFDMVRRMPQVMDGIRCHCGCGEQPDKYSLLSCFEGDGMARECRDCLGQARLAHGLHRRGRTLDEIRAAIDAKYD